MTSEFPEEKFIHEPKSSTPMFIWFFVCLAVAATLWGTYSWWQGERNLEIEGKPFLQVTNRQMAPFLYQFPEFMRENYPRKTGYLTGFDDPTQADAFVQAPPEVLYFYHTWDRLLKDEFDPRPIPQDLFREFLTETKIWLPENWPKAPKSYKTLLDSLSGDGLLREAIPQEVHMAFQGWRNYYKEGDAIEAIAPTYDEMATFLRANPNYQRPLWRNPLAKTRPDYLLESGEGTVPQNELAGFLKAGFYNYMMARQGK